VTFADAPPTTPGSKCGISSSGADSVLGHRVVSAPFSPRPLINHGESFAEPLATPAPQVALVLKDAWFVPASHLPVPQSQSIRRGRQPWETLVVPVDPLGRIGFCPSHSRTTPVPNECCPHFASGSCPWENYGAIDSKITFQDAPRGAIRENVCVTARMAPL
jgi:hypothetical protein